MSHTITLLALACFPAFAEWLSAGVKGGLPLTQTADAAVVLSRYGGQTSFELKRYTLGPAIEIALPIGLSFEADALYKHARQDRFAGPAPRAVLTQQGTRMDIWEIPLLLKYRWNRSRAHPFATAGTTLRQVGDLEVDLLTIPTFPNFPVTRERFSMSSGEPVRFGLSLGGGISWKLGLFRVEPELRYTHWTAKHWMATTEELQFLLGISLPLGRSSP